MIDQAQARLAAVTLPRRRGLPVSERRLLLAGLDAAAVALAFVLAFNLRTSEVRGAGFYVPRAGTAIAVGLWLLCAPMANAWDLRAAGTVRGNLRAVSTTVGLTLGGLLAVFFAVPYRITRPTLLLWVPLAWLLALAGRLAYRRVLAGSYFAGRIAVVARRDALGQVWPEVEANIRGLYRVVAIVDPHDADGGQRLRALVERRDVDQVVVGVRDEVDRDLFQGLLTCHDAGLTVRSLADLYEELTGRLLLDQLGHTWLMALPMRSETSMIYGTCKRAVDIAVAALGALVLGIVLVPLALAIRADGGPLFHRQTRTGKHGRSFTLLKLRTMRDDRGASTTWTVQGDPRITPVGRLLRRLHLDELPQALAILRGEMSLIGPRPEQPQYVERLRREIDFYNTRLTVRPGLTGWAQVNYGYASGVDGARVKLSYDLYYIKRQSASLDLLILGRTLLAVLCMTGR